MGSPSVTIVPNPQAADGRPISVTPSYIAASGLVAHATLQESVYPYDPITSDGYQVDSNDMSTFNKFLGLTVTSGNAGDVIQVYTSGEIVYKNWNWRTGSLVYISGTNISSVLPTSGYIQQVGIARDATVLELRIQPAIQL